MKEIVILSGKGGTGKTSIAGSFAALASSKVLCDCDVDAADLNLLLEPSVEEEYDFTGGLLAFINADICCQCNLCTQLCRFSAIKDFKVDDIACEGCGLCARICPVKAIDMKSNVAGRWFVSKTKYGPLVHARLGIAQDNSGKLVAQVRQRAKQIAAEGDLDYIISDGPPGTGCPVISSLTGADLALLVTEPTLSGAHDLERIIQVCWHFGVKAVVCINKFDINELNTRKIEQFCNESETRIVSRIPYDAAVTEALMQAVPVVEYTECNASEEIINLWQNIAFLLKDKNDVGNAGLKNGSF